MSYVKKTWASGDTITSSALNNIENQVEKNEPLHIAFTVSIDPGTGAITATTSAVLADVISAHSAGRQVIANAEVPFAENKSFVFELRLSGVEKNNDSVVAVMFSSEYDVGDAGENEPSAVMIYWNSGGIRAKAYGLTVASA